MVILFVFKFDVNFRAEPGKKLRAISMEDLLKAAQVVQRSKCSELPGLFNQATSS